MEYVWSCKREPPPELEFGERIRLELHLIRFSLQYFQKGFVFAYNIMCLLRICKPYIISKLGEGFICTLQILQASMAIFICEFGIPETNHFNASLFTGNSCSLTTVTFISLYIPQKFPVDIYTTTEFIHTYHLRFIK